MRIYKYEVPPPPLGSRISDVVLPRRATILSAGTQDEKLYIWALGDVQGEPRHYAFKVIGTGDEIPDGELDGWRFVDTVQMKYYADGMVPMAGHELVWHVWVKP